MPSRIFIEIWGSMNRSEQIALCRTMAGTAIKIAELSPYNVADAFLRLAESWSTLATEITHSTLDPRSGVPESILQAARSDKT